MNPILNRIKAKTEEIGLEAAALYYSGEGPGKKISPAQLQKVIDDQEMPTPRMCLKVCEDLERELADYKPSGEPNFAVVTMVNPLEEENARLAQSAFELASSNASLLARIRILESQAAATGGLAAQGFVGIAQPFNPTPHMPETPVPVQPWSANSVNGVAVVAEPSAVEL